MPRKTCRSSTTGQKAALLANHYVERVPVSQLSEGNDLQLSISYYWQMQRFENVSLAC